MKHLQKIWFSAQLILALTISTQAAPKKTAPKPPAAPTPLGNNVFLLGEETNAPTPPKTKTVPQTNLNTALVNFCRANLGRKVGNGQCTELVVLGLPAIGARLDFNRPWGTPVCDFGSSNGRLFMQLGEAGRNPKNPRKADVRPGDIIQYENVKFERTWNGGYSFQEFPLHTSVIESVSRDGSTYHVLEQNVNGTQFVVRTTLYLPNLTQGVMRITRPTR